MNGKRIFTRTDGDYEDMTGFSTTVKRKYKLENLIEVYNMDDCVSEGMPTMKQVYEYGVLSGMLKYLENEIGCEALFTELKERWNSILEKEELMKSIVK